MPHARRPLQLLSVCTQLAGVALAVMALFDLLDVESRASHVLDILRWPAFALLCVTLPVASWSAFRDALGLGPPIRARILRDLLILCVLAVTAQVLLSHTYKPILFRLCFAIAIGTFAALRLMDRKREVWQRSRWWRGLELSLFCACASLVLLEIGLRSAAQVLNSPLLGRDTESVEQAMQRFRYEPGTLHYGFPCNQTSHYDEKFQAGDRGTVVSIGDSFSFSVVPHHYHFSTVCERNLDGVAVHNLGYAGIGPGGYLHLLETEGLQLEPDLVLVNLFIGNDPCEALRWNAPMSFVESICDRRNVLSYLLPGRLIRLAREGEGLARIGHGLQGQLGDGEVVQGPETLMQAYPWLGDPLLEIGPMSKPVFLDLECERAVCNQQVESLGGYRRLFSCLRRMRALLGATPLCVMMIPDQYQVDDELWADIQARLGRDDLDRLGPQQEIAAWLESEGIPHLDLLPVLREVPAMADGKRHLYHLRDTHFNARGNSVTGEVLSMFLRELLEKASSK